MFLQKHILSDSTQRVKFVYLENFEQDHTTVLSSKKEVSFKSEEKPYEELEPTVTIEEHKVGNSKKNKVVLLENEKQICTNQQTVQLIAQLQLLKLPSPSILAKGLYMNLISWWGLISR